METTTNLKVFTRQIGIFHGYVSFRRDIFPTKTYWGCGNWTTWQWWVSCLSIFWGVFEPWLIVFTSMVEAWLGLVLVIYSFFKDLKFQPSRHVLWNFFDGSILGAFFHPPKNTKVFPLKPKKDYACLLAVSGFTKNSTPNSSPKTQTQKSSSLPKTNIAPKNSGFQ